MGGSIFTKKRTTPGLNGSKMARRGATRPMTQRSQHEVWRSGATGALPVPRHTGRHEEGLSGAAPAAARQPGRRRRAQSEREAARRTPRFRCTTPPPKTCSSTDTRCISFATTTTLTATPKTFRLNRFKLVH